MSSGVGFQSSLLVASTPACPLRQHRREDGRRALLRARHHVMTSCRHKQEGGGDDDGREASSRGLILDRRDVLLALGGAAALPVGAKKGTMAAPLAPELTKCHNPKPADCDGLICCPPFTTAEKVVDYDFPASPLRVRRPAHLVMSDKEYLSKYKEATRRMKALPASHPWSFCQQAKVHCAYCENFYDQKDNPDVKFQVHASWLFFPFHRYYLHFYERILGKLIGDDTFALPFWNFDSEAGMTMPEIFTYDTSSPLYNPKRNTSHYHPAILDYQYSRDKADTGASGKEDVVQANLRIMQKTFDQSQWLPELFMGDPVRAGESEDEKDRGTGALESIHNTLHSWVGPAEWPHEDMGVFSTAARDSIFYCLHANVDRLWHLYRQRRGNRREFDDSDWLDSSFVFCDENERIVRVKVCDCLNPSKLRYTYEEVPSEWMGKPSATRKPAETKQRSLDQPPLVRVDEFGPQPRALGSREPLRVMVPRPKKNRRKAEKEDEGEVLQVKGIDVTSPAGPARFDVYIALPDGDLAGPDLGEFVGSFVKLPGTHSRAFKKMSLKLGLTSILEDIEGEHADKLVVSIVPRGGEITVGGVIIKLVQTK